ncbi:hypothetical protein GGQ85_003046 [Nitrobacter vulgaris]|uniref:Uncharacterized protein n=1 Tax=Nitrobacter vulgaris TaxID=29421 RepID=A0A1V4HU23_NITVU|nr:hypothetical protein [Nitrobacter vulgaris]MDR6305324.1 hypothetical protein [Nitrobacter vulgaris]OPH81481.1 hypothetical protein B2M20_17490 [Nitrobacter vulgaris]
MLSLSAGTKAGEDVFPAKLKDYECLFDVKAELYRPTPRAALRDGRMAAQALSRLTASGCEEQAVAGQFKLERTC